MAELELQVFPGYDWQDGEKVTYEKLRQTARPAVRSVVDLEVGEFNYFQNGNLYGEQWLTAGPQTVTVGESAALARHWWVRPSGGSVQMERSGLVPDNKSFYSLLITGAASVTVVNVGQRIERDLAATLRRQVTLSIWLRNDTGASFAPVLKLRTCNSINAFAAVTERISTALQTCPNAAWTQLVWTADLKAVTDLVNGFELMLEIPSGFLNAASKSIGIARGKLQIGGVVTSFVDERPTNWAYGKNLIINGGFNVAARGNSFNTPANQSYTLDRWQVIYDGTIGTFVVSKNALTQADRVIVPGTSFLRWNHTAAGSGSTLRRIRQFVENLQRFQGRKVTLSFWARSSGAINVTTFISGVYGTGGSPSSAETLGSQVNSITTGWQRFTQTLTVPDFAGKTFGTDGPHTSALLIWFAMPLNVTFQFDLAGVQLEMGGEATPFEYVTPDVEEMACARYFLGLNNCIVNIMLERYTLIFPTCMRVVPTVSGGGAGFVAGLLTRFSCTPSQDVRAIVDLSFNAEF
jgi:hypothetical protein